jgi:hypothetical protein
MPTIRNIHAVEPTNEANNTSVNWPLIELVLLLLVLTVLIGAILILSLWCNNNSSSTATIRPQQREEEDVVGKTNSSKPQRGPYVGFRNGLHSTILLIAVTLSIVTHFSCITLRLAESPSAADDEIHAIGIWKVWHEEYDVCLDPSVVGISSLAASNSGTRALAVLATLFGAASLLLLFGSTAQSCQSFGPARTKAMVILSVVCGVGAASLQGGAFVALHHSATCDDYHCRTNITGAMRPILAILYWISGVVVTLFLTLW